MFDLCGPRVELRIKTQDLFIPCQQQRFQGIDVVGQVGGVEHVPSLYGSFCVYKADIGCHVRSGRRHSIPSSSIDSCACLSVTLPLLACGQT